MQVFIVGSPLETAMALSKRHLNNQINEAKIILDALNGAKAWSNHPCVLQYKADIGWLRAYKVCLNAYVNGHYKDAAKVSEYATRIKPAWHTKDYYDQMKRRLYTKDKEHYKQWADLGESQENWYWSNELKEYIKYKNGKRTE